MHIVEKLQSGIRHRFSAASSTYDKHADVQRFSSQGVMDMLSGYSGAFRVLDVGCGTGILTEKLADALPRSEIDALDVSRGMVEAAKRAMEHRHRHVKWIVADFKSYQPDCLYDLIVSNATLHWISPLSSAIERAGALLKDEGMFVFCIMLKGTLGGLVESRGRIAPGKVSALTLPEANDVTRCLESAGLTILSSEQNIIRRHYESSRAMLHSIRRQGVTGGAVSSSGVHLTRGEINRLMDDYTANYPAEEGGVYADYVAMYVKAIKSGAYSE